MVNPTGVMQKKLLEVQDLSISYATRSGEVEAVRNVSFTIRSGETLALVGESGCGKTTIAFGIVNFLGQNGLIKNGRILFQGQDLIGRPYPALRRLRGNQLAMVFQDPMQALNPCMRLGRQMAEALITHQGLSQDEAWEKSSAMLRRVYMPDPLDVMNRYPHQISGGQQQRVVIAMAMLNNPVLLIMDEPTTALDVTAQAAILDLIAELRKEYGTGILYITHDLGIVAGLADRMAVMYAGEIVEEGSVNDVFKRPRHPYTRGLMNCVPRLGDCKASTELRPIRGRVPRPSERPEKACLFNERCDFRLDLCTSQRPELRRVGQEVLVRCHRAEDLEKEGSSHSSEALSAEPFEVTPRRWPEKTLLRVDKLKKHYPLESESLLDLILFRRPGSVKAVDDITFEVPQGSILGLVGESGCGKTTLIKTVLGLEPSTAGTIEFDGRNINLPLRKRTLDQTKNLQIVFQNPDATLNPSYSIGRQLSKPLRRFKLFPSQRIKERVEQLLRAVRLPADYYGRLPRQLSGGEKQRVGIARALASEPKMILCDEPVSALDVSVQAAVLKLLLDLQGTFNTTMLFVSHDLSVVRYICDIIAVMYLGRIVEIGPAEAVVRPPYHPYTAALLSAVAVPDPAATRSPIRLSGDVPSAIHPPSGCVFHTRCPWRRQAANSGEICREQIPPRRELGRGHFVACHLNNDHLTALGHDLCMEKENIEE
jgi:peptide/nickel transport system ATP-binding protein